MSFFFFYFPLSWLSCLSESLILFFSLKKFFGLSEKGTLNTNKAQNPSSFLKSLSDTETRTRQLCIREVQINDSLRAIYILKTLPISPFSWNKYYLFSFQLSRKPPRQLVRGVDVSLLEGSEKADKYNLASIWFLSALKVSGVPKSKNLMIVPFQQLEKVKMEWTEVGGKG